MKKFLTVMLTVVMAFAVAVCMGGCVPHDPITVHYDSLEQMQESLNSGKDRIYKSPDEEVYLKIWMIQ